MRRPVNSFTRISSVHGQITNMGVFGRHLGNDYATPVGTPVFAPVTGKVTASTSSSTLGNYYEIVEDGNGRIHRLCHLSSRSLGVNARVSEGQQIGLSGNTGISTGPHLHWDVRKGNTAWNASFANYYNPEALIYVPPAPRYDMPAVNTTIQLIPTQKRNVFHPGSTVVSGTINVTDNSFFYTVRYVRNNRIGIYSKSGGSQHSTDYKDLALYYTDGKLIPGWKKV